MLRLLLTGSTGFVGSHVAELLAREGMAVRALARPTSRTGRLEAVGAEIVLGALADPGTLDLAVSGVDAVIHMAACTHARTEAEYSATNAVATARLVRAMREARPRPGCLVYLSSLAAAGPARDGRPVRPGDTPGPITAYGRSKLAGERACLEAGEEFRVVILRAPAVYGPRDREMFRFFRFASLGWIPVPGDGSRPVQLVHVTDLANAIRLAATRTDVSGTFHIAESRTYVMSAVARLVADAVGGSVRIVQVPGALVRAAAAAAEAANGALGRSSQLNRDKARELLAAGWLCETECARRALGFEAAVALPAGLSATAEWYRQNGWLKA